MFKKKIIKIGEEMTILQPFSCSGIQICIYRRIWRAQTNRRMGAQAQINWRMGAQAQINWRMGAQAQKTGAQAQNQKFAKSCPLRAS